MNKLTPLGLCCGSLVQADFGALAEAAGAAGFSSISLWPTLFYDALAAGLAEGDMRAILNENGLHITELDPYSAWLPVRIGANELGGAFHAFGEDDFYRMADALGARSINIIQQGTTAVSDRQRIDLIGGLCERAATHGLLISVEFLPWSPISNLQQAMDLVAAVDCPNFGVNIDIWHHFRSGGTVAQLAEVDPARVVALQFNDLAVTAWDDPVQETSTGRLPPGEGSSDSLAVLQALRSAGVDAPLSVEVFSAELMALPPLDAARRLAASTRMVLAQLDGPARD